MIKDYVSNGLKHNENQDMFTKVISNSGLF